MLITDLFDIKEGHKVPFVNIFLEKDTKLFIDPTRLRLDNTLFSQVAIHEVQEYFQALLNSASQGNEKEAKRLLAGLNEPHQTHLGYSKNSYNGSGVGDDLGMKIWKALCSSEAAQKGGLVDLEDSVLVIEGIGPDRISDILTNVMKKHLISFTQEMAAQHGIPCSPSRITLWDADEGRWRDSVVLLPQNNSKSILLTPKRLVVSELSYTVGDYVSSTIVPHLKNVELAHPSKRLVRLLKDNRERVDVKAIKKMYGDGKKLAIEQSLKNPSLLKEYKKLRDKEVLREMRKEEIDE